MGPLDQRLVISRSTVYYARSGGERCGTVRGRSSRGNRAVNEGEHYADIVQESRASLRGCCDCRSAFRNAHIARTFGNIRHRGVCSTGTSRLWSLSTRRTTRVSVRSARCAARLLLIGLRRFATHHRGVMMATVCNPVPPTRPSRPGRISLIRSIGRRVSQSAPFGWLAKRAGLSAGAGACDRHRGRNGRHAGAGSTVTDRCGIGAP